MIRYRNVTGRRVKTYTSLFGGEVVSKEVSRKGEASEDVRLVLHSAFPAISMASFEIESIEAR